MNRPQLVNFSAITTEEYISIRSSLTASELDLVAPVKPSLLNRPIQSIRLFSKENFRMKVVGLDKDQLIIFTKEIESDNFGNFDFKIPCKHLESVIDKLRVYETLSQKGMEFYLGSYLPLTINNPKKIVICDFDKTLVDTKYSTAKEIYYSLNKPLSYFPTVTKSVNILKDHIEDAFQPFILSASPHIYENAIRNWLYQNQLFIGDIFLKDYRNFISMTDGPLSAKDIKKQGFYKLNQLINILLMTGIPKNLTLMGDGFESDPYIYLVLCSLVHGQEDPWKVWKSIKDDSIFSLTPKQDSFFLTKFYRLSELSRKAGSIDLEIYIRSTEENNDELENRSYTNSIINKYKDMIHYYIY